jgi:hypothetical protein
MRRLGLRSVLPSLLLTALAFACKSATPSAPEQIGDTPSPAPEQKADAAPPREPAPVDPEQTENKPTMAAPPDMDAAVHDAPSSPPPAARPETQRSQSRLDIAIPSINGGLNRDIIRRTASTHADDIRDCHGRALASLPDLGGKLIVELWLDERGRVTNAELTGDDVLTDRIGQCVIALAMGWTFADAGGVGSFKLQLDFAMN